MSNVASHKELQAATKDLNEALGLEPKLKVIAVPAAKMGDVIIDAIAPLVENEVEIAKLAPSTIETYNKLVAAMGVPPQEDGSNPAVAQETSAETPAVDDSTGSDAAATQADEGDCFGVSYDPDNPACAVEACSQAVACAEKVTGKKKKKGPATSKKDAKDKTPKGPGVISTIFSLLQQGPHSKQELVTKLMQAFPGHAEKSLKGTVNAQVPNRMAKEKKVTVTKNEAGQFFIS